MSWIVACFCGAVFEHPATECPVCCTPVPEITIGADTTESAQRLEADVVLLLGVQRARTNARWQ
jgi:hypothetical protein